MSKLIFTKEKSNNTIGYVGGGITNMNKDLWPKSPDDNTFQTHLFTIFPNFFRNGSMAQNKRISVFISIQRHALGGVKDSISSKYTVNRTIDLAKLSEGYSKALIYDLNDSYIELSLSEITLDRKYFEILPDDNEYLEKEHVFFEENGMGMDISKQQSIPYFEQDIITPSRKYSFYLQLLEEDIENNLNIFQTGIGYFYVDRNIKKLQSGSEAGLFFIQNT
ncbi:hypothetical protein SAMN05421766_1078 [Zobellia uliginosa]|uniref:Uncharacterized protein n=1 Tax=Zobellia uliginosa TaxID=143224 RepID=A0ABY1L0B5_9FLAO|nr:hypothetical protein [Zobellia uliginosa]SIT01196.1 hypothetical protein SAMN05421766_1078 [Zobellia uliginosa]